MLFQEIENILLDSDGSCRDINFARPTLAGIETFLTWFRQHYDVVKAYDCEGVDIRASLIEWLQGDDGCMQAIGLNPSEVVKTLITGRGI